jgi:hypothetical protein
MLSAVALCAPSGAAEYSVVDGKLSVTASAYIGASFRTANRDPKLLADADSSVLGIAG